MDEDEAWERFTQVRDDQFQRSSALGTIDVMQAQLNKLTADTEEIKQKMEEMASTQNEAPAPAAAPPMPDMGAGVPGEEGAGQEGVDQMMDQTGGAPGETGQDMMPPVQPQDEAGAGGMPQMTDEDLDLLFGGGNENETEGAEETAEEPQDATLEALQKAISKATDAKVIADLAKMIVDYIGGGDSEGEAILPGVPDDTPISDVPPEALDTILKSETTEEAKDKEAFKKAEGAESFGNAPKPPVADNVKASNDQDVKTGGEAQPAAGDSAKNGGFVAASDEAPASEPGAIAESATCKSDDSDDKEEESDDKEEDKKEESDDKKDEPEESKSEDSDEADDAPSEPVEVEEVAMEIQPEPSGDDEMVSVSELLDMSFGDIIDLVKDVADEPADDSNVFINDDGKKSIPFKNCDSAIIKKSSIDSLIMDREKDMVGIDGKKYQFSKSTAKSRSLEKLNDSLHDYDKIKDMKAGEVISAFRFMKSIGVRGVEENNMDALDVIVRGLDSKIGSEMTDAFMKSAGLDLDAIYKETEFVKSEQPVEGGKHIPTLAETGSMDIKKSGAVADVPRAADAGKAHISPQDMKAGLKSIDDLIAGRMKG